jgi:VanZ family protein
VCSHCRCRIPLSTDRHRVLKTWVAAILWLIVILLESSNLGSSSNTSRILYPLLHFLFGMDHAHFQHWHFFIRKGGHVFGYGLLSILLFRAWRETFPSIENSKWTLRWASMAVAGTAIVASLDEWHQSYLPSRTGTPWDVLLDTCAAIAAQILLLLCYWSFGKFSRRQPHLHLQSPHAGATKQTP